MEENFLLSLIIILIWVIWTIFVIINLYIDINLYYDKTPTIYKYFSFWRNEESKKFERHRWSTNIGEYINYIFYTIIIIMFFVLS